MYIQSGIGNLGTESFSDVAPRRRRDDGHAVGEGRGHLGQHVSKNLPWTCVSGGSQTTHAHDARGARGGNRRASRRCRRLPRRRSAAARAVPRLPNERVSGGGRSMTLAEVGAEGDRARRQVRRSRAAEDINAFTKRSAAALAGQGLMGVARDNYQRDGGSYLVRRRLRRSRSRRRDRQLPDARLPGGRRRRHGDSSARARRSDARAARCSAWATRSGRSGSTTSTTACRWRSASIRTGRRRFSTCRRTCSGRRVDIPDPETPVGARGIGEPPVGAGCCAVLNAISAAVGDEIFRRAPVDADMILTSLEAGGRCTRR